MGIFIKKTGFARFVTVILGWQTLVEKHRLQIIDTGLNTAKNANATSKNVSVNEQSCVEVLGHSFSFLTAVCNKKVERWKGVYSIAPSGVVVL